MKSFSEWLTESQSMLDQSREFWDSVKHKLGNDRKAKEAIARQDLSLLLKLFRGKEDSVAQYAQEKGWPLVALQIRQKIGVAPDVGYWMGGTRPSFYGGDY